MRAPTTPSSVIPAAKPTAANTTGAAAAVTPPSRRSLRRRGGATAAGASSAPPRPQRHAAIKSISVLDHNSDTKHDDHASASASTPPSRLWSIATFLLRAFVMAAWCFYRYFLTMGPGYPGSCKLLGLGCPPPYNVTGFVAPEFEPVRTAFSKNFEIGDEVGASFVAYVDGEPIAELYGGFADPHVFQKPYSPDTLQLIFSSSKAITSIAVLRMVDLGLLDLHAPVARYWPEFAANGKENVTVRDVLMHRAGVSYLDIDRVPTPLEVVDMDGMAARLAEQKHAFGGEPRSAYHAVTRGWYLNEIVRRVDPQGRSLRRIMNEDIIPLISTGAPPGAPYEFHYGFSRDELPRLAPRVAPLDGFSIAFMTYSALMPAAGHRWLGTEPAPRVVLELAKPWSVSTRSLVLSVPRSAVPSWPHAFNRHAIWLGEGPSYNGITNARTLARFAEFMVHNGTVDGITLLRPETVELGVDVHDAEPVADAVLQEDITVAAGGWGLFRHLTDSGEVFYGWAGAGGSVVFWNYEYRIAAAYTMNFCHMQLFGDRRSQRILQAVVDVARRRRRSTADVSAPLDSDTDSDSVIA